MTAPWPPSSVIWPRYDQPLLVSAKLCSAKAFEKILLPCVVPCLALHTTMQRTTESSAQNHVESSIKSHRRMHMTRTFQACAKTRTGQAWPSVSAAAKHDVIFLGNCNCCITFYDITTHSILYNGKQGFCNVGAAS